MDCSKPSRRSAIRLETPRSLNTEKLHLETERTPGQSRQQLLDSSKWFQFVWIASFDLRRRLNKERWCMKLGYIYY